MKLFLLPQAEIINILTSSIITNLIQLSFKTDLVKIVGLKLNEITFTTQSWYFLNTILSNIITRYKKYRFYSVHLFILNFTSYGALLVKLLIFLIFI